MINKTNSKSLIAMISLIFLLLSLFSAAALVDHSYKIDFLYKDGTLQSRSVSVVPEPAQASSGGYSVKLLSSNNLELENIFFNAESLIFTDSFDPETGQITGGGKKELPEFSFSVYVPYHPDGVELVVYDPDGVEISSLDASGLSEEKKQEKIMNVSDVIIPTALETIPQNISEVEKQTQPASRIIPSVLGIIIVALFIFMLIHHLYKKKVKKQA